MRSDAQEDAALSKFMPKPQIDVWARLRDAARFYAGSLCGPLRN